MARARPPFRPMSWAAWRRWALVSLGSSGDGIICGENSIECGAPSGKKQVAKHNYVPRVCGCCGTDFLAQVGNVNRGGGLFCSRRCFRQKRAETAKPTTIRRLVIGEAPPTSTPRRFVTQDGYIVLRWKIATRTYIEALEHRVLSGSPANAHVHHINGIKSDNRPENLKPLNPVEHRAEHREWDRLAARAMYEQGQTTTQIAAHFGITGGATSRGLRSVGTVMRKSGDVQRRYYLDAELVRRLHAKGFGLERMTKHLGLRSTAPLYAMFRRLGLRRPVGAVSKALITEQALRRIAQAVADADPATIQDIWLTSGVA